MKLLLIITVMMGLVANCSKIWKDDKLSINRTNYTGNQLKINGYYYEKYGTPEKLTIYLFFGNGVLLHAGDGYEYNKLNEFEQIITSVEFINKLKGIKDSWGVFKVTGNIIQFERWYPGQPPLKAFVREGVILNDTTFEITESYRMVDGQKKDVHSKNETFHFKAFAPKPDSTNSFVQ